jgi:RimJ/RimL family protein N-acetyltransferase
LILRKPTEADAQALLEIHQDPHILEHKLVTLAAAPGGIDVALRNVDRMTRQWQSRGYGHFVVVEKSSGQVIGSVGLYHPDNWPGAELTWILRRSHWGQGYATEAARAVIDWAWRNRSPDHIISLIEPANEASLRVAEKIGQQFECEDVHPISGERVYRYGIRRPAV